MLGNFNTNTIFGGIGGTVTSMLYMGFWSIMILSVVGVVGYFLYKGWKNKTLYVYPITLTHLYDNGTQKDRHDLRGGKFLNKRNVWDFKIKIPRQRAGKELGFMPDFSKADSDGRICFITSGDGTTWQQYEKIIQSVEIKVEPYQDEKGKWHDRQVVYQMLVKPVPIEDKIFTVNSIKSWRETVDKSKITTIGLVIGGFIIMVIAHLISLYIQTKIKCGV